MSERKKRYGTLDEHERDRCKGHHLVKFRYLIGYCQANAEIKDDDREQGRRSYRKAVSTTWLSKKPRTEYHITNKLESLVLS